MQNMDHELTQDQDKKTHNHRNPVPTHFFFFKSTKSHDFNTSIRVWKAKPIKNKADRNGKKKTKKKKKHI